MRSLSSAATPRGTMRRGGGKRGRGGGGGEMKMRGELTVGEEREERRGQGRK